MIFILTVNFRWRYLILLICKSLMLLEISCPVKYPERFLGVCDTLIFRQTCLQEIFRGTCRICLSCFLLIFLTIVFPAKFRRVLVGFSSFSIFGSRIMTWLELCLRQSLTVRRWFIECLRKCYSRCYSSGNCCFTKASGDIFITYYSVWFFASFIVLQCFDLSSFPWDCSVGFQWVYGYCQARVSKMFYFLANFGSSTQPNTWCVSFDFDEQFCIDVVGRIVEFVLWENPKCHWELVEIGVTENGKQFIDRWSPVCSYELVQLSGSCSIRESNDGENSNVFRLSQKLEDIITGKKSVFGFHSFEFVKFD
uniref:Capsaicin synthase n=1 Tax=Capsicum frutescens TaxID=4073 RepID=B5U1L2_CAPFR|nr:capsaicin synthase [Capsicum frutescens]